MDKVKAEDLLGCFGCGIAIIGVFMIMGLFVYIAFDENWMGGVVVAAAFLIIVGIAICNMVSGCFMDENCRDDWN